MRPADGTARRAPLLLGALSAALAARAGRALRPLGLDVATYSALAVLVEERPASQLELARALGRPPAAIVQLVDRLELGGYAARARSPRDRRRWIVEPTPAGLGALARADEVVGRVEDELFAALELDARASLLRMLRAALAGCSERPA